MQFRTVLQRQTGTETRARPAGPRGQFFAFDYELSHNPTVEEVGVQLSPDIKKHAAWDYASDIHTGVRIGWEDARSDDSLRLCCTNFHILRTRDNPVDTYPAVIRSLVAEVVRKQITARATPLPPLHTDWLTSDVLALARGIHANAALDGLPALCDALLEAGCDDPLVIQHLQTCPDHAPSCWVVEMILHQAAARGDASSGEVSPSTLQ